MKTHLWLRICVAFLLSMALGGAARAGSAAHLYREATSISDYAAQRGDTRVQGGASKYFLKDVGPIASPGSVFPQVLSNPVCSMGPITSGTLTAAAQTVTISGFAQSINQIAIDITGTFSATIVFEVTFDGTNWVAVNATPYVTGGAAVSSVTTTGDWTIPCGGAQAARVRCSAYTSGTATITLNPSVASKVTNLIVVSVPSGANYTTVQGLMNLTGTSGGGQVNVPLGVFNWGANTLLLKSNVKLTGQGFSWTYYNIPDDGRTSIDQTKGTVFTNDGSCPVIGYNITDSGSLYGSNLAFSNDALNHSWLENFGVVGGTDGIHIGSLRRAGELYSSITNVGISGCSAEGLHLENQLHGYYADITAYECGTICFHFRGSSSSDLGPGNSYMYRLTCTATDPGLTSAQNNKRRGIVQEATLNTGYGNGFHSCQSNRFNNANSIQAVTFPGTGTNTDIQVGDLSQFQVGMPVILSDTNTAYSSSRIQAGTSAMSGALNTIFVKGTIYFIQQMSAASGSGTFRLSATVGGSALTYTGATAAYVHTYGMPCMELIATPDGSHITNTNLSNLDLEAGGTCMLLLQGCNPITMSGVGGMTDCAGNVGGGVSTICARNSCNGMLYVTQGVTCDIDASSLTLGIEGGVRGWIGRKNSNAGVGMQAIGNAGAGALFLDPNGYMTEDSYVLAALESENGMTLIGNSIGFGAAGSFSGTISTAFGPVVYLTGAGPFSLPALSKTRGGAYNNGAAWILVNNQPTAVTINATSSAKIDSPNSGSRTSFVIPAFTSIWITGNVDGGGTGAQKGWVTFGSTDPGHSYTDSSGSPGNATHATKRGRVAIAAAGTTVTVTNPLCAATSTVLCQITTVDGTAKSCVCVPGAGSFVITLNAAATGTTKIDYVIYGEGALSDLWVLVPISMLVARARRRRRRADEIRNRYSYAV